MDGLAIVLPAFADADNLPILRDDAILNTGSLMLVDPVHSANPWSDGVPATGTTVPNIAWQEAAALLGSGDASTLAANFTSTFDGTTTAVFERSTKGGLHGIATQSAQVSAQGATIKIPTAIRDYMYTNLGHAFYFSLWSRPTRAAVNVSIKVPWFQFGRVSNPPANYLLQSIMTGILPASGAGTYLGSVASPGSNNTANTFQGVGVSSWVSNPSANTDINGYLANWVQGAAGYSASSVYNSAPSWVFYRAYLEDLTVAAAASGRTVSAECAVRLAADQALWAQNFAVGGRYYDDSWTSPAI